MIYGYHQERERGIPERQPGLFAAWVTKQMVVLSIEMETPEGRQSGRGK